MSISPERTHLWAFFTFGIMSGVARSVTRPPTHVGETITFEFRARESGEGQLLTGEVNSGTLTFLDGGKLKGRMSWMGGFDFTCEPVPTPNVVWSKSVHNWKRIWRSYNQSRWESENQSRWGRCVPEPHPDGPEDSDTSGGDGSDSEDEDMIGDSDDEDRGESATSSGWGGSY